MKSIAKSNVRFVVYLIVIAYLAADLFLFKGPLSRYLNTSHSDQSTEAIVASVGGQKITRSQLNRAIHEQLFLEGKSIEILNSSQRKITETTALLELIDHELLRIKVSEQTIPLSDQEIDARLELFAKKFSTREEMEKALKSQGFKTIKDLRDRIAARIQQEKYVAMQIDPLVVVSENEITEFYQTHLEELKIPERIRARHIFISTLGIEPDVAKQRLQTALTEIQSGSRTFAELALAVSADIATKNLAGDLGWMSRDRLPKDFAYPVFALEKNKPTLIQTKLGFHIVELTDRLPAETPPLETVREKIQTALETSKRHKAVNDFRTKLRDSEKKNIVVFRDQPTR